MFKAVIFDRDGVLVNSEGFNIESIKHSLREFGYDLTEEDMISIPGKHSQDSIAEIIEQNGLDLDFEKVRELQREKWWQLWEQDNEPMPQVKEVLEKLKEEGIVLAVATNSARENTKDFLKEHFLEKFFVSLTTKEDVTKLKPNPDIYLRAKEKLGLPDEYIVVIEDTEVGVEAAKAAGLKCIAVPNEYTRHQKFNEADYVVGALKEVLDIVLRP